MKNIDYKRELYSDMTDTEFELFVARDKYQNSVTDVSGKIVSIIASAIEPYLSMAQTRASSTAFKNASTIIGAISDQYNMCVSDFYKVSEMSLSSFEEADEARMKAYTAEFIRQRMRMQCKVINLFNLLTTFTIIIKYSEEDFLNDDES